MEDIEKQTREQNAEIRRDAELMEQLTLHPGWGRYLALIESVGQNFHAQAMKPLENMFQVTASEYAKGTLNGLSLAASLPRAKIEESKLLRNPSSEEE